VVVLLLMPNLKVYCTTLAKFALSSDCCNSFSPAKPALFIKTLAVFYVSTFIFAGAAFAFLYLNQTGGFVRNGIVYIWNSKGTTLFFAVATVGIIIRIFWDIVQQRISKESFSCSKDCFWKWNHRIVCFG